MMRDLIYHPGERPHGRDAAGSLRAHPLDTQPSPSPALPPYFSRAILHERRPRMMRLRSAIAAPKGRRLRVLIYARYSTEEQHPSSIDDQVAYCQRALAAFG